MMIAKNGGDPEGFWQQPVKQQHRRRSGRRRKTSLPVLEIPFRLGSTLYVHSSGLPQGASNVHVCYILNLQIHIEPLWFTIELPLSLIIPYIRVLCIFKISYKVRFAS